MEDTTRTEEALEHALEALLKETREMRGMIRNLAKIAGSDPSAMHVKNAIQVIEKKLRELREVEEEFEKMGYTSWKVAAKAFKQTKNEAALPKEFSVAPAHWAHEKFVKPFEVWENGILVTKSRTIPEVTILQAQANLKRVSPHLSLLLSLNAHDEDFSKGVLESFNDLNWSYEDFVERVFALLREECQESRLSNEESTAEEVEACLV